MKKQLAKIFASISGVLTILLPVTLFFVIQTQITWQQTVLDLPSFFYLIYGWIPALLCSIAGIVFSIQVKIDTFYMPKLYFCTSVVSLFISCFWGFQMLKVMLKA